LRDSNWKIDGPLKAENRLRVYRVSGCAGDEFALFFCSYYIHKIPRNKAK